MIKINSFKEKIYGNMAMVYHRTSVEDLINKVYTSGFKPGTGAMYGIGFYSTYDLESQYQDLDRSRNLYGDIIVKFAVPIQNFLIFDKEEYKKSPQYKEIGETPENFLIAQLEYFNLKYDQNYINSNIVDNFTSDIALDVYNKNKNNIVRFTNGIIFTGRRDGKVLVAYNTNIIVPISWKFDNEDEFQKVERNMDYLKKAVKTKLLPVDNVPFSFAWIINATTIGADYTIENGVLIWEHGTWENGTWIDGQWQRGVWKDGLWKDGIWKEGFWEDGIWKNGIWKGGWWKDGIWEDGTWKGGEWKMGKWYAGLWKGGTWKDGWWEDGTWKGGIWKNGRWYAGLWEDGTWKGGKIWNPDTKKYEYSSKNPNETEWSLSYGKA